jgi:hypothetical protein
MAVICGPRKGMNKGRPVDAEIVLVFSNIVNAVIIQVPNLSSDPWDDASPS